MDQGVSSVLGLLYWIAIIVLLVKGKIKWVTFLSLLTFSVYPFVIGLIFMYALPKNIIHGEVIPELPMAIALILFISAFFSIKAPKTPSSIPYKQPSRIRWFYLTSGLAIYQIGIMIALMYFYAPQAFGHTSPMPHYGVIANIILCFASSVLLYLASKQGSPNRPNLIRIIVILFILIFASQSTLIISLILMYSFPVNPLTSYPALAGLNMLCYLFFGLLLIFMRREYVSVDSIKAPEKELEAAVNS